MSETLKPCPFCGGEGRRYTAYDQLDEHDTGETWVMCAGCPTRCPETTWNQRAEVGAVANYQFDIISERLKTQDNACTAYPIYVVERRNRVYGFDTDYAEDIAWVNVADDYAETDPEEIRELEAELRATGKLPEYWMRTGYRDTWDFVQPFLTRQAAEEYIESQRHNLGEARVYVHSGYRNREWQFIRAHFAGSDLG